MGPRNKSRSERFRVQARSSFGGGIDALVSERRRSGAGAGRGGSDHVTRQGGISAVCDGAGQGVSLGYGLGRGYKREVRRRSYYSVGVIAEVSDTRPVVLRLPLMAPPTTLATSSSVNSLYPVELDCSDLTHTVSYRSILWRILSRERSVIASSNHSHYPITPT